MRAHVALCILLTVNCACLGLAGSLTCFNLLPSNGTTSSSNSLVKIQTVEARAAADGEVCFKYITRCTANSTLCNAEQVAEGIWRWVYGSMPSSACELVTTSTNENIQYAHCCSSNSCNMPDPELDPETRLATTVQLSSTPASSSQPVAAITAAVVGANTSSSATTSADHTEVLVNTASVNTTGAPMKSAAALISFWPATAHINKVSFPQKAGVYKQPKGPVAPGKQQQQQKPQKQQQQQQKPQTQQQKPKTQEPKGDSNKPNSSSSRNSPRLPHLQQNPRNSNGNQKQQQQHRQQPQQQRRQQQQPRHIPHGSQVKSLVCFRNVPRDRHLAPAVAPRMFRKMDGVDMCGRYKFQCANGDNTCTAVEVHDRVWKWAYMPLSTHTCMELQAYAHRQNSVIQHVQCCSTDQCNRPNPNLDKLTRVITPTAAGLYGKTQPNVKNQAQRPVGRNLLRVSAAETVASAQQQEPEGVLTPQLLACFTSQPRTAGQGPAVVPKVYHKINDNAAVCGRYQLQCTQDTRAACTAAEVQSKVWIWEYKSLSASLCNEMKAIAALGTQSGYRNVSCCSSNACNRPDPAVDADTQVVRAESTYSRQA